MHSLLNKIDDLISLVDVNSNITVKDTRMVFIVGASGAGKTTLAENFRKSEKDCIHFDADLFMLGSDDPISRRYPDANAMKNRSPQLTKAFDLLMTGIESVNHGHKPTLCHWKPFYDLVIPQIKRARLAYPNKHMVISHAVYPKIVRDYIRNQFGNELSFIIINTHRDICTERRRSRLNESIAAAGAAAIEEFLLNGMGSSIKEQETRWSKASHGFEIMRDDEPNTFQIDASKMTKDEFFAAGQKILRQIGINRE